LGLIRLEFEVWEDKIAVATALIVSTALAANKPKLLEVRQGMQTTQLG